MDSTPRFQQALAKIDAANSEDPHRAQFQDQSLPECLLYGQRMTHWLSQLEPAASEALRLAVRSQHLRRWTIPRSTYPMTRPGYHQWRTTLARFHADQAADILRSVGYDDPTIARVQSLIRKERLKADPEAQALEDAACLVFLEGTFAQFASQHDRAKIVDILKKTWRKMSPKGHQLAQNLVERLPADQQAMVRDALG